MDCLNCDDPLDEVFEGSSKNFQMKDALHIQLHLGYGQYRDQGEFQLASPEGCLCKDCAKVLSGFFPGIRKLLNEEAV